MRLACLRILLGLLALELCYGQSEEVHTKVWQRVEKSISGVFSFRRLELRRQRLDMCLWHPVTCTARSWLQYLQVFPGSQPEAVADALPEVRSKETFASAETESRAGVHVFTVPHETSRSGGEGCFGCAVWYACNSSQFSTCSYIFTIFFSATPLLQEGEVDAAISAKWTLTLSVFSALFPSMHLGNFG